jgi:hypothetical protein
MADNDLLRQADWWYSLIAASPTPESGESANVAVVLGDGQASYLSYRKRLPRMVGLAPPEVIEVFERVLESVSETVGRGLDVATLRAMIGPQLEVTAPRVLFQAPTDALVERLVRRYLDSPRSSITEEVEAVVRRSNQKLDAALRRAPVRRFEISQHVSFKDLYGAMSRKRFAVPRIPRIARAVRGPARDLLVDSVVVTPGTASAAVRQGTAKIGKAFFEYNSLKSEIAQISGREIRTVGVLHRSGSVENSEVREARRYIKHVWESSNAEVIDADEAEVPVAFAEYSAWLEEGGL